MGVSKYCGSDVNLKLVTLLNCDASVGSNSDFATAIRPQKLIPRTSLHVTLDIPRLHVEGVLVEHNFAHQVAAEIAYPKCQLRGGTGLERMRILM